MLSRFLQSTWLWLNKYNLIKKIQIMTKSENCWCEVNMFWMYFSTESFNRQTLSRLDIHRGGMLNNCRSNRKNCLCFQRDPQTALSPNDVFREEMNFETIYAAFRFILCQPQNVLVFIIMHELCKFHSQSLYSNLYQISDFVRHYADNVDLVWAILIIF